AFKILTISFGVRSARPYVLESVRLHRGHLCDDVFGSTDGLLGSSFWCHPHPASRPDGNRVIGHSKLTRTIPSVSNDPNALITDVRLRPVPTSRTYFPDRVPLMNCEIAIRSIFFRC